MSRRAKEAIKTGLAMMVAIGIALSMDWEKPYWAGFAVAMISLSTVGQSLNKAAMRMAGTLVAITVALALIALFPQERWLLVGSLSIYIAFCAYMVAGKKRQYFWFVSGFVCTVIIVSASFASNDAFSVAIERAQENGLGILVYGLISAFLWPQSSRSGLEEAAVKLSAVQHELFRSYRALMKGEGTAEASEARRLEEVRLSGQLAQALNAAEADSYDVWEVRHLWRRFRDDSVALGETLERWRESFPEIHEMDLARLFPNIRAYSDEVDDRLSGIQAILAGEAPGREPKALTLEVDQAALQGLSQFERAAAVVAQKQLQQLGRLSRAILETIGVIKSLTLPPEALRRPRAQPRVWSLDPDRLVAALRVFATLWTAFLIWVYVDPPGHATFVQMTVIVGLALAMLPQMTPASLFLPYGLGSLFGGVFYVFVMTQVTDYAVLGPLIFFVTAAIYYFFSEPRQTGMKMGLIVTFVVNMSIKNEQTYDFASYANSSAMLMFAITLVFLMSYFPFSPNPEKVFLRLFARFFRQVDFLLSRMALDWEQKAGLVERAKVPLYSHDLIETWEKLSNQRQQLDYQISRENSPERVQALVSGIGAITYRMKELLESRELQQSEWLVRELLDELRAWRLVIQEQLRLWAEDPDNAAQQTADLKSRLDQRMARLEQKIEALFQSGDGQEIDPQHYENFYRLLGSFRGLSEAGLVFIAVARSMDWKTWQEDRF